MSPIDVDRITIIGDIYTSGIVVTRGVNIRSTRNTEGPDRYSLTLSIVSLIRTEHRRSNHRGRHGKCFAKVLSRNFPIPLVQYGVCTTLSNNVEMLQYISFTKTSDMNMQQEI